MKKPILWMIAVFTLTNVSGLFASVATTAPIQSLSDTTLIIPQSEVLSKSFTDSPITLTAPTLHSWQSTINETTFTLDSPQKNNLFLYLVFIGVGFFSMLFFKKRSDTQKHKMDEQLLMLQMLTQELKTPTTAIKQSIESFRHHTGHLPEASQKAFLQICDDTQHLGRVVEASKNYLSVIQPNQPKSHPPFSLNTLIQSIVNSYGNPEIIRFHGLTEDRMIKSPMNWLELGVRHLIDNALHHGKGPVMVSLFAAKKDLSIRIQDRGKIAFTSLEEMSQQGMGLGLAIVKKAADRLGGELQFSPAPTIFTLSFKE